VRAKEETIVMLSPALKKRGRRLAAAGLLSLVAAAVGAMRAGPVDRAYM